MAREPFNRIWTETPTVDDFREPTDAMWDAGWRGGANQDPPEAFAQNWWQNRADFALRQLERNGAMDWLSDVPYQEWAFARGSDGTVYLAIQSNTGVDPTADDGSNWLSIPDYIKSLFNASGEAPLFGVRAWGNFNGFDLSVRGQGNVASVTRISSGRYQVSFSSSMQDGNYSVSTGGAQASASGGGSLSDSVIPYDLQTSGFKIESRTSESDVDDIGLITFQVVR